MERHLGRQTVGHLEYLAIVVVDVLLLQKSLLFLFAVDAQLLLDALYQTPASQKLHDVLIAFSDRLIAVRVRGKSGILR